LDPKAYRLPTHALPSRYDIEIDARPGSDDFHGKVTIELNVLEPRDTIELHAVDLYLSDAIVKIAGNLRAGAIHQDNEREMAAIRFDEPLRVGEATLEIAFAGKVSKSMEGLYHAQDGVEECLCTQCEETDARAIFPCFDEPAFKAQFAWRVTTSPEPVVLANGPLVSSELSTDGKSKTWTFAATKPMSSYLVALVIGDIAGTPEEVVEGVPLRVWAMRGKEKMGQFAHDYTRRLLPWYNHYFGVPYHYDKYDQVGVPGFAAGAMENSGLVLFRQSRLLMNPQTASWDEEKSIAKVVAHEFAHMWFGNLVTMRWWDDLWLNEAFAEWMAHKVVNALSPDYGVWNDFVASKTRGKVQAMDADALESTHSVYTPVETPAQATELFDVITYEKGCAVLRMLESFLGEEAFRAGLRTYMKEFGESNATGADLWRHLEQASNHPVKEIMESWITQPGYPVVSVSLDGNNTLRLSQKRFFSNPKATSVEDQTWRVPMIIRYEDDAGKHEMRYVLTGREATVRLEIEGKLRWLYANADEIGFYRTQPDAALLGALLANVDRLSALEQIGLFSDQWALVRNGGQTMDRFLEVASAMTRLKNHGLLDRMGSTLAIIERMLKEAGDEQALKGFRTWLDSSFKARLQELGYEPKQGESRDDEQSRATIIDFMADGAHNAEAIEACKRYADKEAADPASVDGNLASTFVGLAAVFGDRERMERHVQIYEKRKASSSSPQEMERYLHSFGEFRPPELVSRTIDLIDKGVVPQESVGVVLTGQLLPYLHAQERGWEYVKENFERLRETLGNMWVGRIVEASGNLPASKRDEIVSFYGSHLHGIGEKSLKRALERLDLRTEFLARTKDDLLAWFKAKAETQN
jgi:puromycin-sensitive aminopeptidase